jgi:hypothetical protein
MTEVNNKTMLERSNERYIEAWESHLNRIKPLLDRKARILELVERRWIVVDGKVIDYEMAYTSKQFGELAEIDSALESLERQYEQRMNDEPFDKEEFKNLVNLASQQLLQKSKALRDIERKKSKEQRALEHIEREFYEVSPFIK